MRYVGDWVEPVDVPPAPDGELRLKVRCYSDRERKVGRQHLMTIHEDWTFTVPHDLEAERVAVALGGYSSCLELKHHVVPAVRAFLRRQLRADLPEMRRSVDGQWLLERRVEGCCRDSLAWVDPLRAAQHLRSLQHISAEFGAPRSLVGSLTHQVLKARGITGEAVPPAVRELSGKQVHALASAVTLWEVGLSPDRVVAMHEGVAAEHPLKEAFYLGVLSRRPDLEWVRDTVQAVPERADHSWLAWTETHQDRKDPMLRRTWLALGVAREDIATLSPSPYSPRDVRQFARLLRVTTTTAGRILATWVKGEVTPDLATLVRVCREAPPGRQALNDDALGRLVTELRQAGWGCTREEAAYVLTLCGSAAVAMQVVARTASLEPKDIISALAEWNDDPRRSTASNA